MGVGKAGYAGCSLTPSPKPGFIKANEDRGRTLCFELYSRCYFDSRCPRRTENRGKGDAIAGGIKQRFRISKNEAFLFELKSQPGTGSRRTTSTIGGKSNSPSQKTATLQDAPITFERQYRMFGAVTGVDQWQRYGNYFDFFWRAKRPSDLTVRLDTARRNCMRTSRHRRFHIKMFAAVRIRPNLRSLETIILTMAA